MIFTKYFYGFLEDNTGLFVLPRLINGLNGCTDFVGYPTGMCQNLLQNNQPFIFIPAFLLAKLLHPVLAYNLIILGGLALNFLFARRFFNQLFGRLISLLLATTFVFSPYLVYQGRSHFDLIQVWPLIWFFHTLFFSQSRHKAIYLELLLTLITGLSNYLGYFTVLATALYLGFSFLATRGRRDAIRNYLPQVVKAALIFIFTTLLFMAPYIKSNYFSPRIRMEDAVDARAVNRPFEDFVIFSSRPWYYVLPSVDNPLFGGLTQRILDRLGNGSNYLTQNYFKAEHSASFLGWVTILLAFVGIIGCKVRRCDVLVAGPMSACGGRPSPQTPCPLPIKPDALALLLTIVGLIILTMPPSIVIKGFEIYTPSYLLFKVFPMFRVLSRMGVLILFLTLIFTGYGYKILSDFMLKKNMGLATVRSVLVILTLFSIVQLYVPPKITHVGTPPKVYSYLGQTDSFKSPIVVYPYTKTNEAFFWLTAHQKALINPRFYSNKASNFESESFTNLLKTTRGLEQAKALGAKYLVYFYVVDDGESADFFGKSTLLYPLDDFKEGGEETQIINPRPSYPEIIRFVEAGPVKENSAILYKFSNLVAGPGFAPGSSDYEPDEVLLLHPAITPN